MKKFTSMMLGTALLVPGVMSAEARQYKALEGQSTQQVVDMQKLCNWGGGISLHKAAGKMAKAPAKAPEFPDFSTCVYQAPEGESILYSRHSYGFYVNFLWIDFGEQTGAANIVWGNDGYAYIYNPFAGWSTNSYLKCEVKDNKLVATLPQAIYQEEYEGETYNYYAAMLKQVVDGENITYEMLDEADQVITFTIDGDSLKLDMEYDTTPDEEGYLQYPEVMFGMVSSEGVWTVAGDCVQEYEKKVLDPVVVPDGVVFNDWQLTSGNTAMFIKVGFDGDDVYLSNLDSYLPDAVVKGTKADGKVTFDSHQYMGLTLDQFIYFFGGTYNDEEGMYYLADNIVFDFDEENQVMTAAEGTSMILNAAEDRVYYLAIYDEPVIKVRNEYPDPKPANPIFTGYADYFEDYGYYYMAVDIPNVNVDGDILDTSNLYYEVYVDEDLFTFYPDEYEVEEPMTLIPYNFSVKNGIYANGVGHSLYFYFEGMETIGMRVYNYMHDDVADENVLVGKSDLVTAILGSGVQSVEENKTVAGVKYYNLAGQEVAVPANGIYVKTVKYVDGTSKSFKVVKK